MQVAIVTVGDELLSGATENTNAGWLARQVSDRGGRVARVLTVPDEHGAIAEAIGRYREQFDAVLVTGGLGGTHDDVTMAAVADAVGREVVVDEAARERVLETAAAFQDANPDLVEEYDLRIDADAWAERPAGARLIPNDAGLAPGCAVGSDDAASVYVLPGPPEELRATFGRVADEFGGDRVAETLYTPAPESALISHVATVREEFDVAVGSYPDTGEGHNRITVSAANPAEVDRAIAALRERLNVVDEE